MYHPLSFPIGNFPGPFCRWGNFSNTCTSFSMRKLLCDLAMFLTDTYNWVLSVLSGWEHWYMLLAIHSLLLSGCRAVVQEGCARSIVFGELGSLDAVLQIGDTVDLWKTLLGLEVAFRSQVLWDLLGKERRDSQELVQGKALGAPADSLCARQTYLLLHLLLKGKLSNKIEFSVGWKFELQTTNLHIYYTAMMFVHMYYFLQQVFIHI